MKNKQIEEILKSAVEHQKVVNGYIFSGTGKSQNRKLGISPTVSQKSLLPSAYWKGRTPEILWQGKNFPWDAC